MNNRHDDDGNYIAPRYWRCPSCKNLISNHELEYARYDFRCAQCDGPRLSAYNACDSLSDDGITRMDAKTALDLLDNPTEPNQALQDILKLR